MSNLRFIARELREWADLGHGAMQTVRLRKQTLIEYAEAIEAAAKKMDQLQAQLDALDSAALGRP